LAGMGLLIVGAIAMVRRVKSLRQYRQGERHDHDID